MAAMTSGANALYMYVESTEHAYCVSRFAASTRVSI